MCERFRAAGGAGEERAVVAFVEFMLASHGRLDAETLDRIRQEIGLVGQSSHPWLALPAEGYLAAFSIVAGDPASATRALDACRAVVAAARSTSARAPVLAMTLQALTWAHMEAGDLDAARAAAGEALTLMESSGLSVWQSRIGANLAHAAIRADDLDAAWRHAERALEAAGRTSDTWVVITVTQLLSQIAARRGDLRSARDLLLSLLDSVADAEALAGVHRDIARYALVDGELDTARSHAESAVALVATSSAAARDVFSVAADVARVSGELRAAWDLYLRAARSHGLTGSASAEAAILASVFEGLAAVRADRGDTAGAAALRQADFAAALALAEQMPPP